MPVDWGGQHRPYGDPLSTYVDQAELDALRAQHGMLAAKRIVYRNTALRIIDLKAQDPEADRDLLAVLHYLVSN